MRVVRDWVNGLKRANGAVSAPALFGCRSGVVPDTNAQGRAQYDKPPYQRSEDSGVDSVHRLPEATSRSRGRADGSRRSRRRWTLETCRSRRRSSVAGPMTGAVRAHVREECGRRSTTSSANLALTSVCARNWSRIPGGPRGDRGLSRPGAQEGCRNRGQRGDADWRCSTEPGSTRPLLAAGGPPGAPDYHVEQGQMKVGRRWRWILQRVEVA